MMIDPLLEILATMLRGVHQSTKQVLVIVRDEPICRRLMSTLGVGPLTALAFRATIDQPERFKKSRDVGAHLGLTPRRYQSGETIFKGGSADVAMSWRARRSTKQPTRFSFAAKNGRPCERGASRSPNIAEWREPASRSRESSQPFCTGCGSTTPNSVLAANRRRTQPSRRSRWSRPEEANLKSSNNPRRRKKSSPWGRWARRSR